MSLSEVEIINLVFSLLGGGLVVGLLNLFNTNRLERKQKKIEFLNTQLQEFYGPLQFFTSCNTQIFKLTAKFHTAYQTEYVDKHFSKDPLMQERISQRELNTINISNDYLKQVLDNNTKILEILTNHYSLIEPDDTEVCSQFIVDFVRYKTEYSESGLRTPLEIYDHIGEVSFMRSDFIASIEKHFKAKNEELKKLLE